LYQPGFGIIHVGKCFWDAVAWFPHRIAIDDRHRWDESVFQGVVCDDIPHCAEKRIPDLRDNAFEFGFESSKRGLEMMSIMSRKTQHQRTFRAYLPGSVIFILFAISEFFGSMITRYPVQSVERLDVPHIGQTSPSTTR